MPTNEARPPPCPSRAARRAASPPGRPYDFRVQLQENGAIVLRWKCDNPEGTTGTLDEVRRRVGTSTTSPFAFVGASGVKNFTDATPIPSASDIVTYEVTAVRSTQRGNPAQFNVTFGVAAGGGGFTITGVSEEPTALAA